MRSKISRGSHAILFTALTVGIIVLINIVAAHEFTRIDLTEDKLYTLDEASIRLVSTLPDRLSVKIFLSNDLPTQVKHLGRYVRDMLFEYQAHSAGKMNVEVVDPGNDEQAKAEATRLKVPPIKLGDLSKTKRTVQLAYLGVAFEYGGKVESIPAVTSLLDLEYQISSTIHRLVRTHTTKIGFSSGHGEPNLSQGLAAARQTLSDYDVVSVDLTDGKKPVPEDVEVLLLVGPQQPFAERAKYEIDQFLMRGKAIGMFIDGMVLQTPRGNFGTQPPPRMAQANPIGLTEQLASYGVKLGADIVMDRQNRPLPLVAGPGRAVLVSYPAFPVVTTFSRQNPITRHLKDLLLIFPSSVALSDSVTAKSSPVRGIILASSSANSWQQTGLFVFSPEQIPQAKAPYGPFGLAVYLKGQFKSFFAGKPIPEPGPSGNASKPLDTLAGKAADMRDKSPASARLVVVGDSDFIKDSFYRLNPANLQMLANTVDFLAQDSSLIAIRAKQQTKRPIEHVEESTITWVKYANVVGLPLALILFGILRWRFRLISRRRRAEALVANRPQ